jgi:hypothetical protein
LIALKDKLANLPTKTNKKQQKNQQKNQQKKPRKTCNTNKSYTKQSIV